MAPSLVIAGINSKSIYGSWGVPRGLERRGEADGGDGVVASVLLLPPGVAPTDGVGVDEARDVSSA